MNTLQRGDVLAFFVPDGIEINVENGITEMTTAMESATGLCLSGGNKDDNATPATENLQWMGNEDEEPENKFRSRFQALLSGRPISSQLVKELSEAAALDIVDGFPGYIKTATCAVSIDAQNKVTVSSIMEAIDGKFYDVKNEIYKQ